MNNHVYFRRRKSLVVCFEVLYHTCWYLMSLCYPFVTTLNNVKRGSIRILSSQDPAATFVKEKLCVVHFHSASIMISVARARRVMLGSAPLLILSLYDANSSTTWGLLWSASCGWSAR